MFTDTDLRDPAPPVPGAGERAAVATRAKQLKRNRRLAAAGGALGVVAMLSLGVVALAGGGSSNPSTTQVQVAGTSVTRDARAVHHRGACARGCHRRSRSRGRGPDRPRRPRLRPWCPRPSPSRGWCPTFPPG